MNSFLRDKVFSEKYEKFFAEQLGYEWEPHTQDDGGVDIFNIEEKIDVKVYRRPIKGHYKGFFIETYLPLSNNPGWFMDEAKATTAYIFVKDAERSGRHIEYEKAWKITRYDLTQAVAEARRDVKKAGKKDLETKKTESGWGFILDYKYIEKYGEEVML